MISKTDLKKIASLAKIEITENELPALSQQVGQILEYVQTIDELNLVGIVPTSHAVFVNNVFRDDVVINNHISEDVLSQAPESDGEFFKVPRVL
ncbi:MAG: aspartyl/glutamyl-tRNA amidotransferase subunit C [uncultured bacterium]|nr:MAG: aspartyl/glutamyl-tRNA amidotransferase subunit C [uncultured bacterium]HLD44009.1 Asp-tRNA(Asn)/Glu-tRNA(Gln) amidotransferase subunit GatC [bacterium]